MAGFYGMQFEALMKEVCEDFGRRLIRGWDEKADKNEIKEYVREAAEAFFKKTEGLEVSSEGTAMKESASAIKAKVTIERVEEGETSSEGTEKPKKKARASSAKSAKKKVSEAEEETTKSEGTESKSKLARKATKGKGKPKCEGVTAKGTQCSKCAIEGEVFCSVHLKKVGKTESEGLETEKKAPAKKKASKKEEAPVHTHEIGEEPEKECEVCEKYGDVFEVPEYEEYNEMPIEEDNEDKDPSWGLEEEDFDEDD